MKTEYIDRNKLLMHMADIQFANAPKDPTDKGQVERYRGNGEMVAAVMQFPAAEVRPATVCEGCVHFDGKLCRHPGGLPFANKNKYCYFWRGEDK